MLHKVESGEALTPVEARIFRSYGNRLLNTWNGISGAHSEGVVSDFLIDQLKRDVVATCRQYRPLREMVFGMFEVFPDFKKEAICERLVEDRATGSSGV